MSVSFPVDTLTDQNTNMPAICETKCKYPSVCTVGWRREGCEVLLFLFGFWTDGGGLLGWRGAVLAVVEHG